MVVIFLFTANKPNSKKWSRMSSTWQHRGAVQSNLPFWALIMVLNNGQKSFVAKFHDVGVMWVFSSLSSWSWWVFVQNVITISVWIIELWVKISRSIMTLNFNLWLPKPKYFIFGPKWILLIWRISIDVFLRKGTWKHEVLGQQRELKAS